MTNKISHLLILEAYGPEHKEYLDVYMDLYKSGRIVTETPMTQQQIQALFNAIDKGVRAGENVGADVAGTVPKKGVLGSLSNTWLKFKDKIAQSGPVSGFDVTFDKLQKRILGAAGGKNSVVGQAIQKYRNFATKYPKMQGAIFMAMSILAGLSGWGLGGTAIVAAVRTIDRMLQGDRASSAIWQGLKTLGVGAAAAGAASYLGGAADASNPAQSTAQPVTPSPTDYIVKPGDTLSDIAKAHGDSVQELLKANPELTNPDVLKAGQHLSIPPETGSQVYQGGTGTAADTLSKIKQGTYSDSPISRALAAKAGLKESLLDYTRMNKNWQLRENMKLPQISAVYLTEYGINSVFLSMADNKSLQEGVWGDIKGAFKKGADTASTGITRDKLDLFWRRNYKEYQTKGSVDSQVVIDFLHRMGVKDGLIKSTFDQLKIPFTATATPADVQGSEASAASLSKQDTGTDQSSAGAGAFDQMSKQLSKGSAGPDAGAGAFDQMSKQLSKGNATSPPTDKNPTVGQEIEFPGTNVTFSYNPQWTTTDGKPAGPAASKILNQLAAGASKSDLITTDLISARRNLYKGSPGMTEARKRLVKKR